jgi:GMP synthase-like glutamine amidotransferase
MNIHYFKHVPFEGLGSMYDWVKNPEHKVTGTKFYEDHKLPFVDICDMLIVMGGPMGVYDERLYPWMKEEKKFIEKAIAKGKKVIGICLGAQMIADVLGAKVYKNTEKEIGWFPVTFKSQESKLFSDFPASQTVMHWHGDTFDLPAGCKHIAQSDATPNQAFTYKDHVVALQFHMEITPDSLHVMIENCRNELKADSYIQNEDQMRAPNQFILQNNILLNGILEKMKAVN